MALKEGRMFMGRMDFKSDLLLSLTELCKKEKIKLGVFSVIGALTSVRLGYYHQDEKKYVDCVNLNKKLEISSCMGNVSLTKELEIFVHAHITLADHQGKCYGGHLMPGSAIFAAEYYIKEIVGDEYVRKYDSETGLNLW